MNNEVLLFSPTEEKTRRAGRVRSTEESYGHTVQSVPVRSIVHKFLKRSLACTKPERVLMGLL